MPQINRIRVNNVKYNFGTQVYDDFVMRMHCSNTIYDLANGGGKSLLMLLLLQNVIPNCTLDDKQPIEKLFRQGCGNTVIHSLVEWKLDPCYQKEQYKYMTTGFCARKAKSGFDAEDASDENGARAEAGGVRQDNASVEYFNYCIFYREYGDNDIKNLPLTSNGERITYNGLKAYLRELEKGDFHVSVRIFDRKGDYQSFLSEYGIFESQWELIRGINKTEGHVRTYFETNYKTSRKVVEDLLIEEIIQKSFHNRFQVDSDEGKMAETLMDIKDKLLELSKKHAAISNYDRQIAAIDQFADYVGSFTALYDKKEDLENQLFSLLTACRRQMAGKEKKQEELAVLRDRIEQELVSEQKHIQTAEIISEQNSLQSIADMVAVSEQEIAASDRAITALTQKLMQMESANDFYDYLEYQKAMEQTNQTLQNRMRDQADILLELKAIANAVYDRNQIKKNMLTDRADVAKSDAARSRVALEEAQKACHSAQEEYTVKNSFVEFTKQEIAAQENQLAQLMKKSGLLVAENAQEELITLREQISMDKRLMEDESAGYEEVLSRLEKRRADLSGLAVGNELLRKELEQLFPVCENELEDAKRSENLIKIYNAPGAKELPDTILAHYRRIEDEGLKLKESYDSLKRFAANAKEGRYTFDNPLRKKLKDYLIAHYKEDVVEGDVWFRTLNPGQKRDVMKRAPFVEYGFIIKEDFERIKEDAALINFERGAFAVPIISEQILYDTKLEVNKELITFARKDLAFLRDESRLEAELSALDEELEGLYQKIKKQEDRAQVIWEDYLFVARREALLQQNTDARRKEAALCLEENEGKWKALEAEIERLAEQKKNLAAKLDAKKSALADSTRRLEMLELTQESAKRLAEKYDALKEGQNAAREAAELLSHTRAALQEAEQAYEVSKEQLAGATEEIAALQREWEENYQFYYEAGAQKNGQSSDADAGDNRMLLLEKELTQLDGRMLESRFFGLKAVIDQERTDMSDKEALFNHYRAAMDKCKNAIEYRGTVFAEMQELYQEGSIAVSSPAKLRQVKEEIAARTKETADKRSELEAQNALMNRLEGSIAHGIHQIEERYGSFEPFACENPETFMEQHKELVKKLHVSAKEVQGKLSDLAKGLKELYVMHKDLERIVANAGISVPIPEEEDVKQSEAETAAAQTGANAAARQPGYGVETNIEEYENISKEYDRHMKLAGRKKEEFDRHRQALMDVLSDCGGQELANEVKISVKAPHSREEVWQLIENLKETNSFIALEKDRISKGIEDMERIKGNFENRCIQTCSNIKTELDRLPQLSTITLENETISVIRLHVPYVKEEYFKAQMSAYIDETIVMAESFSSAEERLKYIRSRLTWKRLFSVIVTDMNAIRVELYKRERLKDQSRYLRYEEAVGSTGQSQGIYIQFLIAVIHYISSIHAKAQAASSISKTIFIDNPFGAAKDIYIWEPIFKLLKTNHVQLIVPARGATPAITGRFDVNYVLGQQLVDNRQQTVVVDYYSRTNPSLVEYTRMDYEQASFDFL